MSNMSYIGVIDRYHEYREAIHELMGSIVSGISDPQLISNKKAQCEAIRLLSRIYPFVDLLYVIDENGMQVSDNIAVSKQHPAAFHGQGKDRSQRPYFKKGTDIEGIFVTEPYLSNINSDLSISASVKVFDEETQRYFLIVVDIDLPVTIEFLMGDTARRNFQPMFKVTYAIIAFGLFAVVISLLYTAFHELYLLMTAVEQDDTKLKPFGIIIFLTLGLAIFDLGKTTLEEEVLMHKDIFRHSSTRRTITRFIAAILIAVSIESLLLMFKSALGYGGDLISAVWMMLAAVGLLVGLGLYVYLGAKAESMLLQHKG